MNLAQDRLREGSGLSGKPLFFTEFIAGCLQPVRLFAEPVLSQILQSLSLLQNEGAKGSD